MAILRMDHVSVVVEDLAAATAFFAGLGMEVEGGAPIQGEWVDRIVGYDGLRCEVAMLRTPDGHGRVELTRFDEPAAVAGDPSRPNATGLRTVMFAVDDVEDAVARALSHGGELVGEIVRYEDSYRLCYVRGPEGVLVALAQPLQPQD
ncbi:MAG TPA: VOC family protein [Frankiaceae bacterium]|nr:VOC family protein [Frankiaceae bacterium]